MKPYEARGVIERRHTSLMADALKKLEHDVLRSVIAADGLPPEWQDISPSDVGDTKRDKVTMRLDRDVIRFFKAMGPGYQERMASVMRAWMHGRLAKVIDGPDTTDIVLRPKQVAKKIENVPDWGNTDQRGRDLEYARGQYEVAMGIVNDLSAHVQRRVDEHNAAKKKKAQRVGTE